MKTGHPLRGHREHTESHNRGLFLEITHLLAKYDGVLQNHFENRPQNATYTSMTIQNEFYIKTQLHSLSKSYHLSVVLVL